MRIFPRSRHRVRREAADWVARIAGGASREERRAFREWHDADPRHAETYARITSIWNAAGRIAAVRGAAGAEMVRPQKRWAPRLALAASFAGVIAIVAAFLASADPTGRGEDPERVLFATSVGEIRQVGLPDGSRVILDGASRLEASYDRQERRLSLEAGRARFRVAHGERPFIVSAGGNEIIATGTLFDVDLVRGRTAVLLLEGSILVRAANAPAPARARRLAPGQKLIILRDAPPTLGRAAAGEARWTSHMLEFDDVPLAEVVELVNRYSRSRLILADDRIGRRRVTGAFRAGDVAGFARTVAALWDLRLETLGDGSLLLSEP